MKQISGSGAVSGMADSGPATKANDYIIRCAYAMFCNGTKTNAFLTNSDAIARTKCVSTKTRNRLRSQRVLQNPTLAL